MPNISTEFIRVEAEHIGFDLVAFTTPAPPPHLDVYKNWLEAGYAGEMYYLHRHLPLKADPRQLLPSVQSLIVVACNYYWPQSENSEFQIARYARGDDYHPLMKKMLQELETRIRTQYPALEARAFVDSGPLLEKELAMRAGLGWLGKNTNLIHPQKGSWFLLGSLLTNIPLPPDPPFEEMHCGSCTRCLDACPTDAFIAPFQLDARRCIAYLTIELRETIPESLRSAMQNHLFGCDICQSVCPWNIKFAQPTQNTGFFPRAWIQESSLSELLQLTPRDFELRIAPRSPIKRPKFRGFLRNAIVVAGNSQNAELRPILENLKTIYRKDTMLVNHLDWAIQQLLNQPKA